jgi:hypothetical protein
VRAISMRNPMTQRLTTSPHREQRLIRGWRWNSRRYAGFKLSDPDHRVCWFPISYVLEVSRWLVAGRPFASIRPGTGTRAAAATPGSMCSLFCCG